MGKSNRIRVNRATTTITSAVKPKKKSGMPLWAQTAIAVVVAILVLAMCAGSILTANGFFKRHTYPVKSDNYKISTTMMNYFYQQQVSNFKNNYSSYTSYLGVDLSGDLKAQPFSDTAKQLLGTTAPIATWHDYLVEATKSQTKQLLMLCEEANARGIKLEEAELTSMNQEIFTLESAASMYGYSIDQMVASQYGEGMKLKDLKAALKLKALANKLLTQVQDELLAGITDTDITNRYNEKPDVYDHVDYLYYNQNINYTDVAKEVLGADYTEAELKAESAKVLEAYAAKIADAKAFAEKLSAATTAEEFEKLYLEKLAGEQYDTKFESLTVADDKKPSAEDLAEIKATLIADVLKEVADKKELADDPVTKVGEGDSAVYSVAGKTVTKEFAEAIRGVKNVVFSNVQTKKDSYRIEKGTYSEDTTDERTKEIQDWLYGADAKVDTKKNFFNGDGAEGEVANNEGSFVAATFYVTKAKYRDDTKAKNFAYMVFETEAEAKAAIEAFKAGTISADAFKALANTYTAATSSTQTDYTKGSFGVDAFDEWLFADTTKPGAYTETPISTSASVGQTASYVIAFYEGEGTETWKVYVKSDIFYDRYEIFFNDLTPKHPVKVNDKAFAKM
ncbi:MAG: hypothetical protein J6S10_04640 [Clostridia bacterium]|nr:hypothetical protein [Clostridia bacterium]